MPDITPEEVAVLEGLLAKATPGPWALISFGGPQIGNPETGDAVCTMWGSDWNDPDTGKADPWRSDAALIVAAKNTLPSLIAAYKSQAEQIAKMREA